MATVWIGASEVVVAPPTVVLGVPLPPGLAYGLEFFNPDDVTDAEVDRMGRVGLMAEVDLGIVAHLATGQEIWMCTDGVRLAASVSIGEPEVEWRGCSRITWLERLVGS